MNDSNSNIFFSFQEENTGFMRRKSTAYIDVKDLKEGVAPKA